MNTEFAKDFIALQSEIGTLPKDKSGYGYKYTDLDTVISTIKPIMKKNHFGFTQFLRTVDGKSGIETMLIHESGETMGAWFELPAVVLGKANNAQNVGASITYIKRYALCALLGCSSDEDTCAVPPTGEPPRQQQQGAPQQQYRAQGTPNTYGGHNYQR